MDEKRLLKACELVEKGKYSEAHSEFVQLAENTQDALEKAWPLIYAANTLQTLGQQEAATVQLSAARDLIEKHRPSVSARKEKFAAVECFLDFGWKWRAAPWGYKLRPKSISAWQDRLESPMIQACPFLRLFLRQGQLTSDKSDLNFSHVWRQPTYALINSSRR